MTTVFFFSSKHELNSSPTKRDLTSSAHCMSGVETAHFSIRHVARQPALGQVLIRGPPWPKTHLLVTSVTCCLRDKAAWLRAVTSVQKKLQRPYLRPENCARQFSFLRHISGTAQSSFLILTLTEISKAGVKHTYLGQIALTRREPLATDDACLIDRAGGL